MVVEEKPKLSLTVRTVAVMLIRRYINALLWTRESVHHIARTKPSLQHLVSYRKVWKSKR